MVADERLVKNEELCPAITCERLTIVPESQMGDPPHSSHTLCNFYRLWRQLCENIFTGPMHVG